MSQQTVLLVEDNPRDVRLTQRAFKQAQLTHELRVVRDGDEALAYLNREGMYQDTTESPRPNVILLDLNLPRMGGARSAETSEARPEVSAYSHHCPNHVRPVE